MDMGYEGVMMKVEVVKNNDKIVKMKFECSGMRALIRAIDEKVGARNWHSATYDYGNGAHNFDI